MRLNVFLAQSGGLSRRSADKAIAEGRIIVNGQVATVGQSVDSADEVTFDGHVIIPEVKIMTILLNKPAGYVCSRDGQGSKTVYDLLPEQLHHLKTVGRLDKDSSGLILLTNNGQLANQLTHPRYQKAKVYELKLDKPLAPLHQQMINDQGIELEDGLSHLMLERLDDARLKWRITMNEGRNRQIRRTFATLGYTVTHLNRIMFGSFSLASGQPNSKHAPKHLASGKYRLI